MPPKSNLHLNTVRDDFRELVEQTSPRLVRLSARIVGDVRDAEDVVQEAFMKAHQALVDGRFEGRASMATWLYRVVTRASIDVVRQTRRWRRLVEDNLGTLVMTTPGDADQHVALLELSQWLVTLPREQQEALVLKALEGFTSKEVAEILQCSEGAVEQRLVRARAALRELSTTQASPMPLEGRLAHDPG